MSTIGFIGLGTMGRPMAKNLLKAGHELVFFARREEVAQEFLQAGARRAATPAAVTEAAEFVITIVTADAQLTEVVLGTDGVLAAARPEKMLIDMSTVSPATVHKLAAQLAPTGMTLIDAPVSGGPWGAEAGTLTIMIGGVDRVVERARPLLTAVGKNIFHVGPLGAGQTVKLANQMVAGGIMALVGEAFVLAKAAGVDPHRLADVMEVSSGNSAVFEARGKKFVLAGNYVPGFMTELMRKDVALAVEMAQTFEVDTPLGSAALVQYDKAIALGHGSEDFAAVVKVVELEAGVKIVEDA
jgi:3-hydroxyisobutyrate dehydrogenase